MNQSPNPIIDPQRPLAEFHGRCALTVMAKAPKAGRVKTRLSPPLNSHQAARLNIAFLQDTIACLRQVAAIASATVVISYTPAGAEADFAGIVPADVALLPQRGDGFGARLQYTTEDLLAAGFDAVCLIDSDSPTVPRGAYVDAVQRLLEKESCAVLGPSDDGGYYLLGLQKLHPRLFEDIAWSTAVVEEQTRQRAAEIGLPVHSLPVWFDVDDRRTLARLYRELQVSGSGGAGFPATHTAECLRALSDSLGEALLAPVSEIAERS